MKGKAMSLTAMFSVASVLFGWHAGGGFATGNQANQFYVISGWLGPVSAILAMLLLTLTIRQAMEMYNERGLTSAKQLFETLYHPYDRLELVFEIYYYIMVLMATSSSIAGAATLLVDVLSANYMLSILLIGVTLLLLTMFGSDIVRKASAVMSILILVCAVAIFVTGICARGGQIREVFSKAGDMSMLPGAVLKGFQYAGFQCACIPTMVACCDVLKNRKEYAGSMRISFVMNAVALCLSVVMLLGWESVYAAVEGGSNIPTLTVCKELGKDFLIWAYFICLLCCFISTGVGAVFGIVTRFENNEKLEKFMPSKNGRRLGISVAMMAIAMFISLAGLTNIIKYGYGYCGYIGIAIIIIPFLTVGVYKNRRYRKEA